MRLAAHGASAGGIDRRGRVTIPREKGLGRTLPALPCGTSSVGTAGPRPAQSRCAPRLPATRPPANPYRPTPTRSRRGPEVHAHFFLNGAPLSGYLHERIYFQIRVDIIILVAL